jgi:hypothetical protein
MKFELLSGGATATQAAPTLTPDDEPLATVAEAAAFLRCHRSRLYKVTWLRRRLFKVPGVGTRIRRSDLRLYVHLAEERRSA